MRLLPQFTHTASMWDMWTEDNEDGIIRVTGLQPDKGAFASRKDALMAFVRHDEGWERHEDGFIVFHHEDCAFGESDGDDCTCTPHLIAPLATGHNH